MPLVTFTREDGSPIAINPSEVASIGPRRLGGIVKIAMGNGATFKVKGEFEDVVSKLEKANADAKAVNKVSNDPHREGRLVDDKAGEEDDSELAPRTS